MNRYTRSLAAAGTLCLMLSLQGALAQTPSAAHFDPRAYAELNPVIMLCATEPGSARFAASWRNWVAGNPEADVYAAVQTVVSRAGTFQSMAVPGMEPVRQGRRPAPEAIAAYMLDLVGKPPPR